MARRERTLHPFRRGHALAPPQARPVSDWGLVHPSRPPVCVTPLTQTVLVVAVNLGACAASARCSAARTSGARCHVTGARGCGPTPPPAHGRTAPRTHSQLGLSRAGGPGVSGPGSGWTGTIAWAGPGGEGETMHVRRTDMPCTYGPASPRAHDKKSWVKAGARSTVRPPQLCYGYTEDDHGSSLPPEIN